MKLQNGGIYNETILIINSESSLNNELKIECKINEILKDMPEYVKEWHSNLKASRKTAATRKDYVQKVKMFLSSIKADVSRVRLNEITKSAVTDYYISIQTKEDGFDVKYTSDSYQLTVWCCLNNFLDYLSKMGYISSNYMSVIDKPKNHDLERVNENRILLTEEDFKKILRKVNTDSKNKFFRIRDTTILLLFMNTGMRKTALSTIDIDDIDLENKTIRIIDKGTKRHEYVMNDKLTSLIYEWMELRFMTVNLGVTNLFTNESGEALTESGVYKIVKKYSHVSPHKLRSGYCSILYNKTGDIEFVRRAVGHSNASTTQRYIVTKGEEKKKASEIMGNLL